MAWYCPFALEWLGKKWKRKSEMGISGMNEYIWDLCCNLFYLVLKYYHLTLRLAMGVGRLLTDVVTKSYGSFTMVGRAIYCCKMPSDSTQSVLPLGLSQLLPQSAHNVTAPLLQCPGSISLGKSAEGSCCRQEEEGHRKFCRGSWGVQGAFWGRERMDPNGRNLHQNPIPKTSSWDASGSPHYLSQPHLWTVNSNSNHSNQICFHVMCSWTLGAQS